MNQPVTAIPPRVGFISLGCPKALSDSERILTQLRAEGYGVSPTYTDADLVVVNTCGFIDAAVTESLEAIDEALTEHGRVIVTGCLGADADRIRERFPQVLAVSGPHAYQQVMAAVHAHLPAPHAPFENLVPPQGVRLTPRHFAYLKISEGCNHQCSFCVIPRFRGPLVSRPLGEVMQEADNLVAAGVKELLVVSQDAGAYGLDVKHRTGFWGGRPLRTHIQTLAEALGSLGVWVRLHYVYPYPHVDNLIPLMADGHILPYLDVPLQHGSPRILKAMGRPAATERVLDRIHQWREICPDITLRSTFIVGFPGETEQDFETLLDFIREAQLDRVGCFCYSPVEGAPANALPGAIPEAIKEARMARFMAVQAEISQARLAKKVGQRIRVLVDHRDEEGTAIARSSADAPEIDGLVFVSDGESLQPGDWAEVEIIDASEHDLFARQL
ncbi:ribosomal protein S12 methylthiotransferase [Ectothiorhodospira magna]|uniref:Ribosomal protein uS12 methylthiotransferase RimO n=1 Tax=Ectothiorhodospira magna TaxID=867345 RepID=A0A1H9GS03_9GAMM|nr:30S ribosomal protein S12 methylthiotransferase RimO [Ectothiorhodospira magna]SEQ52855.1 ribosomal protein S12 methylthiotransferase [Ectothiorhodospira magna]